MKITLVVMQPAAPLSEVLLEKTCDLAKALSYVEAARLVSRHVTADGGVESVQQWRLRAAVPELLRAHLADGLLEWTLSLSRLPGTSKCQWRAESAAQRMVGCCEGTLEIRDAVGGRGSRLELDWDFPTQNEGLRTIFGTLLTRYWRGLAEAAAKHVAASAQAI